MRVSGCGRGDQDLKLELQGFVRGRVQMLETNPGPWARAVVALSHRAVSPALSCSDFVLEKFILITELESK